MAVPPVLADLVGACHARNASGRGGRTAAFKFYEIPDNLRKALTPNDFSDLDALANRLLAFGQRYRQIARPFEWTFTREDLDRVLAQIANREPHQTRGLTIRTCGHVY